METNYKELYNHKAIYDGEEDGYYSCQIPVVTPNEIVNCTVIDFKNVFHLAPLLSSGTFLELLESVKGWKNEPFNSYKGQGNLNLVFSFQKGNKSLDTYLIILTEGESQPGRYKIFLEGIWQWPIH